MVTSANNRDRVARLCRSLAEKTGDGRFRTAAAILAGRRAGRRAKDDAPALHYAEALIKAGMADSIHRACIQAAVVFAPPNQVETTRDRLRRKLRRQLVVSDDSKGEHRYLDPEAT